jgi:transcriptional regulator with XRE-family HTH domain
VRWYRCVYSALIGLDAAREELTNMAVTNVELLKLGLRIRAFRKVLGRNQKDFSKQCGLDRSYFGGVERGERNLSFFILCQICAGLNCDIAAVTKGIPPHSRSEVAGMRTTLYHIKLGFVGLWPPEALVAFLDTDR